MSFAAAPLAISPSHDASGDAAVSIDWHAPRECPDAAYVERGVSRLSTGGSPAGIAPLRAQAQVTRDANGKWSVVLTTASSHGTGRRIVFGESCRALADATALILAFAADPDRATTDDAPAAEATPPAPAVASSAGTPANPTAPPDDSPFPPPMRSTASRETYYAIGIAVIADAGTLLSPAPGLGVSLAASPKFAPLFRAELGAAFWPDQTTSTLSFGGSGPQSTGGTLALRASLRTFDLGACMIPFDAAWLLGACADAEFAWATGTTVGGGWLTSNGGSGNPAREATWFVMRGRATTGYRLSDGWLLRGDIGFGLEIDPPRFGWNGTLNGSPAFSPSIVGGYVAYGPSNVSGRASLGLELRF